MRTMFISLAVALLAPVAVAQTSVIEDVIDGHVLSGFTELSEAAQGLSETAQTTCDPNSEALREAWGVAFDAWLGVAHLRFGPSETDDRAFALAFWPDTRGKRPKALTRMILQSDPSVYDSAMFAEQSIAVRGFYAMEYMLFDDPMFELGGDAYRCALIRAQADDIAITSAAILYDWTNHYAALMRAPDNDSYRTQAEVMQQFYKAVQTGLQVAADARLGRPLGSFEHPRPKRAESWRSERSLHNLVVTIHATEDLALRLAAGNVDIAQAMGTGYARVVDLAETLDDPVFAGVADPQKRLRVEVVQSAINSLRDTLAETLAPALGVSTGFNALDGD